uniref:ubiquitinyl hydrolase 1 n=1 Tax=Amazona collaria TaxID=241587 RepID=A0A8B9J3P9_9PSIT
MAVAAGGVGGGSEEWAVQRAELGMLIFMYRMPGESWYLVDMSWFRRWKEYVDFDSWDIPCGGDPRFFPGPIDNSGLFRDPETQTLKDNLVEHEDYVVVPAEAWDKLPIERKVVERDVVVKRSKVEVYPLELKLCKSSDPDTVISCRFSIADTVATIEAEMRKVFNITEEKEARLWGRDACNCHKLLCKLDSTVKEAGLYHGQVVLIELNNEDGTWPGQPILAK